MLKLIHFLLLISFVASCGKVDKTNDNFEKANQNIAETNAQMSEARSSIDKAVELVDSILNEEKVLVFKRDFLSPDDIPEKLKTVILKLDEFPQIEGYRVNIDELEIFKDADNGLEYFLIPSEIKSFLSDEKFKDELLPEDSLWRKFDNLIDKSLVKAQELLINTLLENEDYMLNLMAKSYDLIKLRKCPSDLEQSGYWLGKIKDIKFWQIGEWGHKRRLKINLENLEESIDFVHCRALRDSSTFRTLDEIELVEKKLITDWDIFKKSWVQYYNSWKISPFDNFSLEQSSAIVLPGLIDPRVIGLHNSLRANYAQQMSYLWVVKGKLLNGSFDNFRNFILSKATSGLEIDPVNPFSFSLLSEEEFTVIRQFFERALSSTNTKDESETVRQFIADAVFVMYERQLINQKIQRTKVKLGIDSKD